MSNEVVEGISSQRTGSDARFYDPVLKLTELRGYDEEFDDRRGTLRRPRRFRDDDDRGRRDRTTRRTRASSISPLRPSQSV